MPDAAAGLLAEIERACSRIRSYLNGMDLTAFLADPRSQDAVLMQLIVAGEAAKSLAPDVRAEAPETAWDRLIGLRNRIAHGYDALRRDQIWFLIEENLSLLETAVSRMLAARGE